MINEMRNEFRTLGRKNLVYQIFNNPNIYFVKLFVRTIWIGLITLSLSYVYIHSELHGMKIPSSMHSLIGIVIGLLLVFRTNTAYDRWWEGRKSISSISAAVSFFMIKLRTSGVAEKSKGFDSMTYGESIVAIKLSLRTFLLELKRYLKFTKDSSMEESMIFHGKQVASIENVIKNLYFLKSNGFMRDRDVATMESSLNTLLEHSNVCERIKNTPIPMSYALHIKVSIFIYLMTLPFGLFYDLGMWATPVIMLIYYMIAGIEIISNEIENPFAGDPNDLPVEELIDNIINTLD